MAVNIAALAGPVDLAADGAHGLAHGVVAGKKHGRVEVALQHAGADALGRGVDEGKPSEDGPSQQAAKYVSRGLTRSRTDNLVVMRGGSSSSTAAVSAPHDGAPSGRVTALSGSRAGDAIEGAVALKQEAQHDLSPTEKLEALQWSKAGTAATQVASKAERRAEAKAKGYEGEMCSECGNFTLVRNGTCMKCDTCGSTTGCS